MSKVFRSVASKLGVGKSSVKIYNDVLMSKGFATVTNGDTFYSEPTIQREAIVHPYSYTINPREAAHVEKLTIDDFPRPKPDKILHTIELPEHVVQMLFRTLAIKIPASDQFPYFKMVACLNEDHVVATDAHRLMFESHGLGIQGKFYIHKDVIELARRAKMVNDVVYYVGEKSSVLLDKSTSRKLIFRNPVLDFPDYRPAIPKNTVHHVINTNDFKSAVKESLKLMRGDYTTKCIFWKDRLDLVNYVADETMRTIQMTCTEGKFPGKFVIGFNLKFLGEMLDSIPTNTFEIIHNNKYNTPVNFTKDRVLMPVLLAQEHYK